MSSAVEEILVIKPSSLGDIIHGLQVVNSIRVQRPSVRISWVVADAFAPIVQACGTVDEVFIFNRKGGVFGLWRLLREIRRSKKYDYVLDLQGLARSGLMTFSARSKRKIGRSDAREGAGFFYSEKAPFPKTIQPHAVEILSQFLPLLGLSASVQGTLNFDIPLPQLDLPEALNQAVLIFPESRREEKNWPYFREFLEVSQKTQPDQVFIWCGSADSSALCPKGDSIFNLAGQTSLLDVIALIQSAGAVIANDSGPIHLAAALGTPVLALFGPTPIETYGPYPIDAPDHFALRADDGVMGSLTVDRVCLHFEDDILPLITQ